MHKEANSVEFSSFIWCFQVWMHFTQNECPAATFHIVSSNIRKIFYLVLVCSLCACVWIEFCFSIGLYITQTEKFNQKKRKMINPIQFLELEKKINIAKRFIFVSIFFSFLPNNNEKRCNLLQYSSLSCLLYMPKTLIFGPNHHQYIQTKESYNT